MSEPRRFGSHAESLVTLLDLEPPARWRRMVAFFPARKSAESAMTRDAVLSIALLSGFIWAVRFLLPKAVREQDGMALTCAVLTAVLALLAWLLIGVSARS